MLSILYRLHVDAKEIEEQLSFNTEAFRKLIIGPLWVHVSGPLTRAFPKMTHFNRWCIIS